jgi:MoaA/NifB/PqqE/SkfB family radical SAM enzyme
MALEPVKLTSLTRRRGSYNSFIRGLNAANEAGIRLDLSIVVTSDNCHELDAMHAIADRFGVKYRDYANMSPTINGGAEPLTSQSLQISSLASHLLDATQDTHRSTLTRTVGRVSAKLAANRI